MKIDKTYCQTKYNVGHKVGRAIKYIVVHNTATTASAENNCKYFSNGVRNASADFFINTDGSIFQFNADPANYYCWHVGDGGGKYGITNANSIGIECVSAGTEFTDAQKNSLRDLIAYVKATYGPTEVVRHYDASRKRCPAYYVDDAKWQALKNYILSSGSQSSAAASQSAGYTLTDFIKEVQSAIGVTVDGKAGPKTLAATPTISSSRNKKHAVVKPIQKYLNAIGYSCGSVDGSFGAKCTAAVKKYQAEVVKATAKNQDGVISAKGATWKKLLGLS